ncbi:MAG: OmpH family outer membrane protein [Saprospiraceae bacterium]
MKYIFSLLIGGVCLSGLNAQKFGHINSAVIIQAHPKVAEADVQLEAFQKVLQDSFELKAKGFQERYLALVEQSNTGALAPVVLETKKAELIEEQNALRQEEQQLQFRMLQRREQLLQPILTEVDSFIQAIGKEGNYTMIFDTSVKGALLFATDSEDLTELLKGKCISK